MLWRAVLVWISLSLASCSAAISYIAAAVQFTAVGNQSGTAAANNRASFDAFDRVTAGAAQAGAQMVVFPEAVLWHWGLHQPGPVPEAPRAAIFEGYAEA